MKALRAWAAPSALTGRRGRLAVGLALATALTTSACAAGQQSETAEELPTLDGTNADIGSVHLRGLAIFAPGSTSYPVGSSPELRLVIVNNGNSDDQLTSISSPIAGSWGTFASETAYSAAVAPATIVPSNSISIGADSASPSGTDNESTTNAPTDTSASTPPNEAPTLGTTGATAGTSRTATAPADQPVSAPRGVAVSYGVPAADGKVLALLDTKERLYPGSTIAITFTFAKAGSKTVRVPVQVVSASYTPTPSYFPSGSEGNQEGS